MMQNETISITCQAVTMRGASALVPKLVARSYQVHRHFQKHGFAATLRKISGWFYRQVAPAEAAVTKPVQHREDEALGLQAGEWVETKSYAEILETLDANGRHRGLLFMPDMAHYCGQRFRVYKPIERLLMEDTGELRRMRNTVLLEGVMCKGLNVGCDRSCFHFWREAWLRRVYQPAWAVEHENVEMAR